MFAANTVRVSQPIHRNTLGRSAQAGPQTRKKPTIQEAIWAPVTQPSGRREVHYDAYGRVKCALRGTVWITATTKAGGWCGWHRLGERCWLC